MPNFASGFLDGYSTIKGIQTQEDNARYRKERDALGDKRWEKTFDQQEDRYLDQKAQAAETRNYQRERTAVGDERYAQEQETSAARHEQTVGFANRRIGLQEEQAERDQKQDERTRKEEVRKRSFEALMPYMDQLDDPKVRSHVAQQLDELGVPITMLNDPKIKEGVKRLEQFMQGALISREAAYQGVAPIFDPLLQRAVGKMTPEGDTIVSAEFADVIPGQTPGTVIFEGKFTTDTGRTYRQGMTRDGKISDDAEVVETSIKDALGRVKGVSMAQDILGDKRIKAIVDSEYVRSGGSLSGDGTNRYYVNSGRLIDRQTGATTELPASLKDKAKRREKAVELAGKEMEGYYPDFDRRGKTREQANQESTRLTDQHRKQLVETYMKELSPGKASGEEVTESDIEYTMKKRGMTRAQVLQALGQ